MNKIQKNTQVVWRQKLQGGLNKICIGTVLAFSPDGKTATVSFPVDRVRRTVPVADLKPASGVFGYARVDPHPARLVNFLR